MVEDIHYTQLPWGVWYVHRNEVSYKVHPPNFKMSKLYECFMKMIDFTFWEF